MVASRHISPVRKVHIHNLPQCDLDCNAKSGKSWQFRSSKVAHLPPIFPLF